MNFSKKSSFILLCLFSINLSAEPAENHATEDMQNESVIKKEEPILIEKKDIPVDNSDIKTDAEKIEKNENINSNEEPNTDKKSENFEENKQLERKEDITIEPGTDTNLIERNDEKKEIELKKSPGEKKKFTEENKTKKDLIKKIFYSDNKPGLSTGIDLGLYLPFPDYLGTGTGAGIFIEWHQTRYFSVIFGMSTGLYHHEPVQLNTTVNGQSTLISLGNSGSTENSLGWFNFSLGPRFSYPIKYRLSPGFGLIIGLNRFNGGSSNNQDEFDTGFNAGFQFEFFIWYQMTESFSIGFFNKLTFWSFSTVNKITSGIEEEALLSESLGSSDYKLQLSLRYRIF